jgi:hypothetical protein
MIRHQHKCAQPSPALFAFIAEFDKSSMNFDVVQNRLALMRASGDEIDWETRRS